ncbi:hypothetical protein E4U19_002887 [Claviceps sp. Clav32 group G5]|nr:hypothetical protein E4U19_002887 [Claviceps sp. Clav32 group G5]KAG6036692.1 hypothetical protein E4U40_000352 [Claviceps sp. LM458 group G5]KAG6047742.1 hypothetical protein E4U39_000157 [Claviceps sp. Clav50 group G5]
MQLLSAILVAVAATGAVADIPATTHKSTSTGINNGPYLYPRWCNHGTAGNEGCEASGRHTYCIDTHAWTSADVPGYTVPYPADPLLRGLPNGDGCFEE